MEKNHWNNKVWYAYGTSITSVKQGKYVPYLAQLSGMKVSNFGVPGGGITNLGAQSKGQVKNLIMSLEDGKQKADLITLEVGANEDRTPNGDKYSLGDDTFCGCLNQCIRYLQENTNAQIVVIGSVITTDEPSLIKDYYERYNFIEEVCKVNRVPFIGMKSGLGYARIFKENKYVSDFIHQSELGGYNLAQSIWAELKNIPLWYAELPE